MHQGHLAVLTYHLHKGNLLNWSPYYHSSVATIVTFIWLRLDHLFVTGEGDITWPNFMRQQSQTDSASCQLEGEHSNLHPSTTFWIKSSTSNFDSVFQTADLPIKNCMCIKTSWMQLTSIQQPFLMLFNDSDSIQYVFFSQTSFGYSTLNI